MAKKFKRPAGWYRSTVEELIDYRLPPLLGPLTIPPVGGGEVSSSPTPIVVANDADTITASEVANAIVWPSSPVWDVVRLSLPAF